MHHRSALHKASESDLRPRKKVTWNLTPDLKFTNDPQVFPCRKSLYGATLQNLCLETQNNLARLDYFRSACRNISLTLEMSYEDYRATISSLVSNDHKHFARNPNEKKHQIILSSNVESVPTGALRSKDAIQYLQQSNLFDTSPFDDSGIDIDFPEPAYTLCYFCSTMKEHRRHIKNRNQFPRPRPPEQRYEAPRPKVRIRSAPPKIKQNILNYDYLYKLTICTGDVNGAGTSADVYVALEGTNDSLPRTKLKKRSCSVKFYFQRNSKETFYLRGPFLGELKTLVVEHTGLEDAHCWFLDTVEVYDVCRQRSWIFQCGLWMSLRIGSRRLQLNSSHNSEKTISSSEAYRITVETGDRQMAGTDANVSITLYGSQTKSDKIILNNQSENCFERGKIDTFIVKPDQMIGKLKKIRIEHDNKGMAAGWFLNKITIENLDRKSSSESVYVFPYNGWLANDNKGGKIWQEIEAQTEVSNINKEGILENVIPSPTVPLEKLKKYQIFTTTESRRFAGTDARVFIQIIGASKKTAKLALKSEGNCFEKGNTDLFEVEAIDVGQIYRIIIGHDGSGIGSGWYLKQVVIRSYEQKDNPVTADKSALRHNRKYLKVFEKNRFLADISEASNGEEDNEQENLRLKAKSTNNAKKMSESPAYIEYTFICEQWLATDEGDGKTSKTLEVSDVNCFYE